MKNKLFYILLLACGGLLLANTRMNKEKPEYEYFFIEQTPRHIRQIHKDKFEVMDYSKNRFINMYLSPQTYIAIQLDSLESEKWKVVHLQNTYNIEYHRYFYSAILKREKGKE